MVVGPAKDERANNKALVRRFLEAMPPQELDVLGACLAEDALQHYQLPSARSDDGSLNALNLRGRAAILHEIHANYYRLFRRGTIKLTFQSLIAEGDMVASRFVVSAITTQKGRPYENYYNFLWRCKDCQIAELWEYVDTLYAAKVLFGP